MCIIKNLETMAACCMLCLTACQQDEFRSATSEHVPVRFAPERATVELTRVTDDSKWENGDEIGIYMVPTTSTDGDDGELAGANFTTYADEASNIPYVITQGGNEAELTIADDAKPIYYPVSGESVDFVAYYPYNEVENGVYKVNVQDQNTLAASDLLYAKTTTGYNKENTDLVELNFEHQLSRLILKVAPDDGIVMKLTGVTLKGFPTTADFDLKTGKLSKISGIAEIDLKVAEDGETEAEFNVILVPHNGTGDPRTIDFTIDGMVYTYEFDNDFDFNVGISNECTLTFTGTRLTLEPTTITLGYQNGATQRIQFSSSAAQLDAHVSSSPTNIEGNSDWFDYDLQENGSDGETNWNKYELTVTSTSAHMTDDGVSTRTAYIHLVGAAKTTVIEVTQTAKSLIVGTPNPASFDNVAAGGATDLSFDITTNSPDEPEILSVDAQAIPRTVLTKTQDGEPDQDDITTWTVTFDVAENPSYRCDRSSTINVTIGGVTKTVTVTQPEQPVTVLNTTTFVPDGMTNCYVVEKGESVTFSVLRAYSDADNSKLRVDATYDGEFEIATVWDSGDVVKLDESAVNYKGSHAGITIQTANEGNAVIALKRKDTEEIVWSYHIWVGTYKEVGGWMDPHIGGAIDLDGMPTKPGNVYQWGRKDPFPGAFTVEDGNAITYWVLKNDPDGSPDKSIKLPDTFFTNTWTGANAETRWADGGTKTVHDPCPHGYKVPTVASVTALEPMILSEDVRQLWVGEEYVVWMNECLRDNTDGTLWKSNKFSFWTSNSDESGRANAMSAIDWSYPILDTYADDGMPVRCVAE